MDHLIAKSSWSCHLLKNFNLHFTECPNGLYGSGCVQTCDCGDTCHSITGQCPVQAQQGIVRSPTMFCAYAKISIVFSLDENTFDISKISMYVFTPVF